MAISIITTPNDIVNVYNEIVLTALSTNIANDNFTYLVDIYINGSATYNTRLRVPPIPNGGFCVVDLHRILESYVSSDMFKSNDNAGSYGCPNSSLTYEVKVGEEYILAGVLVTNEDEDVTTTLKAVNGSLSYFDFVDYDYQKYIPTDINSKHLTNAPTQEVVSKNDLGYLYYLDPLFEVPFLQIRGFNDNNVKITDCYVDLTNSNNLVNRIPFAPKSIDNIDISDLTILQGATPMFSTNGISYYTIDFLNNVNNKTLKSKKYILREDCENEMVRLIFLNRLGGYDAFNFYGRNNSEHKIERKNYKKTPNRIDASGNYSYSKSDKEKVQYYTKTTEKISCNSDWITEEEEKWLLELIESPEIYMQVGNELISVAKIEASSHKIRKHISEKLFKLEVKFELGTDNYRQRG